MSSTNNIVLDDFIDRWHIPNESYSDMLIFDFCFGIRCVVTKMEQEIIYGNKATRWWKTKCVGYGNTSYINPLLEFSCHDPNHPLYANNYYFPDKTTIQFFFNIITILPAYNRFGESGLMMLQRHFDGMFRWTRPEEKTIVVLGLQEHIIESAIQQQTERNALKLIDGETRTT